ncbi:MAG: nitrogenase stabilizing/protective protein NifW [Hyphomicrobiaceae bacterium]|nr:nitrogenase stabilizing/protective protein NifW [Hyphomicrobiaceae bacterium]
MSIVAKLKSLSAAEEFFDLLGVDYDPKVVSVARLHILKRMGQLLASSDLDGLDEAASFAAARDLLTKAYADFVGSTPIEQRVFKVLKDAVAPKKPAGFVPLSMLTGKG